MEDEKYLKMLLENLNKKIDSIEDRSRDSHKSIKVEMHSLSSKIENLMKFKYKIVGFIMAVSMLTSAATSKIIPPPDQTQKIIEKLKDELGD